MCSMFDIQRHRAKRESGAGMLLDQKATEEEERGGKKNELELTEIFSVLFCS